MIEFNAGREQLKLNRTILHLTAIGAIGGGILAWSIAPFVTPQDSIVHRAWRYSSLIFTGITGTIALVCGHKLEQSRPLYRAILRAEESVYLHQVASSQYRQQKQLELLAESELTELPEALTETYTQEAAEVSEVPGKSDLQASTSTSGELDLQAVTEAVSAGKSDTWIIENLLGMGGRKFKEGKFLLAEIKHLINQG